MNKIWLKNYQAGVANEIDPDQFRSVVQVFEHSARQFHSRPAIANMGKILSYGELDQLSQDFAAFLQQELQLAKGSRIAIMLPNLLQYPVSLFGALRAGLTVVNINPLYTPPRLSPRANCNTFKTTPAQKPSLFWKILPMYCKK